MRQERTLLEERKAAPPGAGLSRKFLCALMSVVLAVGLMPLPAFADLTAGEIGTEAVQVKVIFKDGDKTSQTYTVSNSEKFPTYKNILNPDGTTTWGNPSSAVTGWVLADHASNGFINDGATNSTFEAAGALVANRTYTFYASKSVEACKFYTKAKPTTANGETIARAKVTVGSTDYLGFNKVPTLSGEHWTFLGWKTQGGTATQNYATLATSNETKFYEVSKRPLTAVVGPTVKTGTTLPMNTVQVMQYFDESDGASTYSLDVTNLQDDSLYTNVPDGSGWELAGFETGFMPVGEGTKSKTPAYASASELANGVNSNDDLKSLTATKAPTILAVYKRTLTLRKYPSKAEWQAAKAANPPYPASASYPSVTKTQYFGMTTNDIAIDPTNDAASNPDAFDMSTVPTVEGTTYSWLYDSNSVNSSSTAQKMGFSQKWSATASTGTVSGVYPTSTVTFKTEGFTVEYWDRNASGQLVKMESVDQSTGSSVALTTGANAKVGDKSVTRSGWTVSGWTADPASALSGGSVTGAADQTIKVYPTWTRDLHLYSGNHPSTAVDVTQTWNTQSSATPTTTGTTTMASLTGWTAGKWATTASAASGTIASADLATYTGAVGADNKLWATYSRSATINYSQPSTAAKPSSNPTGWKASDSVNQTYNSGQENASAASFTLPSYSKTGNFNWVGWTTADNGGGQAATSPYAAPVTVNGYAAPTLYAKWNEEVAPPATVGYTVDHFQQSLSGTYNAVSADHQSLTATEGTAVSATSKTYSGFTYNATAPGAKASESSVVEGTALKFYYDRNKYSVTVQSSDPSISFTAKGVSTALPVTDGNAYFGDKINITASGTIDGDVVYKVGGTAINLATWTVPANNVTITAEVTKNKYHVVYHDGASNLNGTDYDNGASVTLSSDFTGPTTKAGNWTITGWAGSDGNLISSGKVTLGGANVDVYAVWGRTIAVKSGTSGSSNVAQTFNVKSNQLTAVPSSVTATALGHGWQAKGWTADSASTTPIAGLSNPATYNGNETTLYATYSRDVTLTFDQNATDLGATGTWMSPATATKTQYFTTGQTGGDDTVTFAVATGGYKVTATSGRPDYKLIGWRYSAGTPLVAELTGDSYAKSVPFTQDVPALTLYAAWEEVASGATEVSYAVAHFQQSLTGTDEEVVADRSSKTGYVGDLTSLDDNDKKQYVGFNEGVIAPAVTIEGEGTVAKIFYERQLFEVFKSFPAGESGSFTLTGTSVLNKPEESKFAFDDTISIAPTAAPAAGKTFEYTVQYANGDEYAKVKGDKNGVATFKVPARNVQVVSAVQIDYVDPTPDPGQVVNQDVNNLINSAPANDNNDFPGSSFFMLQLRYKKAANNYITLSWTNKEVLKYSKNVKFVLLANQCGKGFKYEKKAEGPSTFKSYKMTKLKKGKSYKAVVAAYDMNTGKRIAVSKTVHVYTKGGKGKKYGNVKKFKLNKKSAKLKAGKTLKLKTTVKWYPKAQKKPHRKVKFESANTSIATVNAKGKIKVNKKAKKGSKVTIYAYATDGTMATCKITVK